jgi:hypothetical protein
MRGNQRKPNKPALVISLVVHVAVTALTWRDLQKRPAEQIRGNKMIWRVVSAANTMGSAAYWLFGRRRGTQGSEPSPTAPTAWQGAEHCAPTAVPARLEAVSPA